MTEAPGDWLPGLFRCGRNGSPLLAGRPIAEQRTIEQATWISEQNGAGPSAGELGFESIGGLVFEALVTRLRRGSAAQGAPRERSKMLARTLVEVDTTVESARVAEARLHGTVWQSVASAHVLYGACVGLGQRAARIGVSANALTYTSLVLSIAAGVVAAGGHFVTAAVLMLVGGAFDALDGVVARATGTVSRWGALLDSTVDRLADASPLLGVALFYSDHRLLALIPVLAMVGGFAVSYVRARAEALGTVLPPLFMRRAERVVLTAFSLFAGAVVLSVPIQAPLLLGGVTVLAVLNAIGAVAVLVTARRALLNDERANAR